MSQSICTVVFSNGGSEDKNMFFARASTVKFLMTIFLMVSPTAFADVEPTATRDYLNFLIRLNNSSPLEHAASRGTMGLSLGLGFGVYHHGVDSDILREHWRSPTQDNSDNQADRNRLAIPRLYVHKGLPASLDVGLVLGQEIATKAKLISGYLQWTAIEGLGVPAVGVRGSLSRLMGLATTDASAMGVDGIISYSVLNMLTVYTTIGLSRHQIEVRSGQDYGTDFGLTKTGEGSLERVLVGRSRSFGVQCLVLPPLFVSTAEVQMNGDSTLNYLAKISVGI